tara:strand:+ start:13188 stop:13934 length:747 start_codon:yes stop_codon:yes gene_type:complete
MKNNHLSYRSGNPVLTSNAFDISTDSSDVMTINGTVTKTFLSLCLVIISGYYSWIYISITNVLILPSILFALILGGVTVFKKHLSPITVPIYAVVQGIFLGALSYTFNTLYDGIVITAISYTLSILFVMLTLYRTGIIKPTENFKLGLAAGTGGIALIYLVNFVMSFFGTGLSIMDINNASMLSIGFSLFVIVMAALNLVVDFDFIEEGSEKGAPKYMEWFGAFGLMVTLIWLYIEILRLLAKMNSRK